MDSKRKKPQSPTGSIGLFTPVNLGADDKAETASHSSAPMSEGLVIDLKLLPSFQVLKDNLDNCVHESGEGPLHTILNYLNIVEKNDGATVSTKAADRIVKELNGLIFSLPQYKHDSSHLVITKVRDTVLEHASPILRNMKNSASPPYIKPNEAKILPELFNDFQNAFRAKIEDELVTTIVSNLSASHSR